MDRNAKPARAQDRSPVEVQAFRGRRVGARWRGGRARWRDGQGGRSMTVVAIDLDRLLKLRLLVARFGEMDLAKWWNTMGQLGRFGSAALRRGFPRTHRFAQARAVFAVAAHRCA